MEVIREAQVPVEFSKKFPLNRKAFGCSTDFASRESRLRSESNLGAPELNPLRLAASSVELADLPKSSQTEEHPSVMQLICVAEEFR